MPVATYIANHCKGEAYGVLYTLTIVTFVLCAETETGIKFSRSINKLNSRKTDQANQT